MEHFLYKSQQMHAIVTSKTLQRQHTLLLHPSTRRLVVFFHLFFKSLGAWALIAIPISSAPAELCNVGPVRAEATWHASARKVQWCLEFPHPWHMTPITAPMFARQRLNLAKHPGFGGGEAAVDLIYMAVETCSCANRHAHPDTEKDQWLVLRILLNTACAHTKRKRGAERNWMEPERNDRSGTITLLQKRTEKGKRKRKEKQVSAK